MPEPDSPPRPCLWNKGTAFLLALAVGLITYLLAEGLPPAGRKALAISAFAVAMWVCEVLPMEMTAILLPMLYILSGCAAPPLAFAGFGDTLPWFVYLALIIGLAVEYSGLGQRIAWSIIGRAGASYRAMLAALFAASLILTFLTPSGVSRIIIMFPVAAGMVASLVPGREKESNVGRVVFLCLFFFGNNLGYGFLTGVTPNVTAAGLIGDLTGKPVLWSDWLLWLFPPALVVSLLTVAALLRFFPPEVVRAAGSARQPASAQLGPMTAREKRAALYVGLALLLWATDRLHGQPPWAVALLVSALSTAPGIGVLSFQEARKVPFQLVIFVGATLSLGKVLIQTGVAAWMGQVLLGRFIGPGTSPEVAATFILLVGGVVHIPLMEVTSMVAAYIPTVIAFLRQVGLDPYGPSLVAAMASDMLLLFPFMSMPMLMVMAFGYFRYRDALKACLIYFSFALAVQVVACFTWYRWIGLL